MYYLIRYNKNLILCTLTTSCRFCNVAAIAHKEDKPLATKKSSPNFEKNLQELETLVNALETGDLSLEDSLVAFEKGIEMTRACQNALESAEQKVNILLEKDGKLTTKTFDTSDNN